MLWGGEGARGKAVEGFYRYDLVANKYHPLGQLPLPEWFGFSACAHGSDVYVMGGSTKGRWTGALWRYGTADGTWTALAPMNFVRRRTAAATVVVPVIQGAAKDASS